MGETFVEGVKHSQTSEPYCVYYIKSHIQYFWEYDLVGLNSEEDVIEEHIIPKSQPLTTSTVQTHPREYFSKFENLRISEFQSQNFKDLACGGRKRGTCRVRAASASSAAGTCDQTPPECVHECVCVCVRACMRACVRERERERERRVRERPVWSVWRVFIFWCNHMGILYKCFCYFGEMEGGKLCQFP